MHTLFYAPSASTIASPLVVAPKATAPFIRLCWDYRQIRPASGILPAIVRKIFADFEPRIIAIFGDFLILAGSYQDAAAKLTIVLQLCKDNRLVLKMKKSCIGTNVVIFFGYEVKPGSWGLSQSRKDSIFAILSV